MFTITTVCSPRLLFTTVCSPRLLFTTRLRHHPFCSPSVYGTTHCSPLRLFTSKKRVFRSVCNQKHRIAVAGSIVGVVCSMRFAKRPDGSSPNRHDADSALFEILGTLSASCGEQPAHTEADVDCCPTRRRPVGCQDPASLMLVNDKLMFTIGNVHHRQCKLMNLFCPLQLVRVAVVQTMTTLSDGTSSAHHVGRTRSST